MSAGFTMNRMQAAQARPIPGPWLIPTLLAALMLLGTACGDSVDAQLAEIRSLQEAGQFDPSIAPLRKLLATESSHPEANYRLGIALVRTGRPSLAVWPLQKASGSEEYAVQAGLLLASTLVRNQAYGESIRASTRVLDLEPNNIAALSSRGKAELNAGQPAEALDDAERILALRPDDHNAALLYSAALLDLDRPDEAEASLKNLYATTVAGGDENVIARTCAVLAIFYRSQEDNDRARATYEKCLAEYPAHALLQQWVSDFYLDVGEPEDAIAIWRAAVERTPEDLSLRSKLADLLYGQGQEKQALSVLNESVELFDTPTAEARKALEQAMERTRNVSDPMRFALADMLIEEGDYERAAEIAASLSEPAYRHLLEGAVLLRRGEPKAALARFDAGLRLWPNNAGARYLAGMAAQELGDRNRAMAEYREAVRVAPDETDAALRLAEMNFAVGQYQSTLQFADRHIRSRPYVEPTAHVIAARSATALGLLDRAESLLKNLQAKDESSPVSYVELAAVARRRDGSLAAVAVIRDSGLDLGDPANIDALRSLASDQLELGRSEEAIELVGATAGAEPQSAELLDLYARVLLRAGREAETLKKLDAALALDPDFAPALEAKGGLLRTGGDLDGALGLFRRAAEADPDKGEYVYLAAQILLIQGHNEAAVALLEKAVAVEPGHVEASNDLAWLLASRESDLERALDLAKIAVRVRRSAETLDTLGYVHLRKGDAEQAVSVLGKALEERPDSPSIEYRLGVALAATGDKERARAVLTKALESPPFPEAAAARAELARLQDS
ncbi:MAG: tetratricopeptide repeat protein [Deltaproteobacteria bacterium]|nr:tetratricopeptide repeat protein [Deltaproteobacteria bacterium]